MVDKRWALSDYLRLIAHTQFRVSECRPTSRWTWTAASIATSRTHRRPGDLRLETPSARIQIRRVSIK